MVARRVVMRSAKSAAEDGEETTRRTPRNIPSDPKRGQIFVNGISRHPSPAFPPCGQFRAFLYTRHWRFSMLFAAWEAKSSQGDRPGRVLRYGCLAHLTA